MLTRLRNRWGLGRAFPIVLIGASVVVLALALLGLLLHRHGPGPRGPQGPPGVTVSTTASPTPQRTADVARTPALPSSDATVTSPAATPHQTTSPVVRASGRRPSNASATPHPTPRAPRTTTTGPRTPTSTTPRPLRSVICSVIGLLTSCPPEGTP